jgi:hypothetical protein
MTAMTTPTATPGRAGSRRSRIEDDDHLRVVLRHVERNPFRAGLFGRVEDWPWSSLRPATVAAPTRLDPGPAPRREGRAEEVDRLADDGELARPRRSVAQAPPSARKPGPPGPPTCWAWNRPAGRGVGLGRRLEGDATPLLMGWEQGLQPYPRCRTVLEKGAGTDRVRTEPVPISGLGRAGMAAFRRT